MKWLWRLFLDLTLPLGPVELSPEDKLTLGQFYDDDLYRSYRKLVKNYEYTIMTRALSVRGVEADHNLGQLFALRQLDRTLKKLNKEYRARKR